MIDRTRNLDAPQVHRDRRKAPRMELIGQVRGRIVEHDIRIDVREVGLGGFSIETSSPLPAGVILSFALRVEGSDPITLRARVVHCRPKTELHAAGVYVTGLEFLMEDGSEEAGAVAALVDRIASVVATD